MSPLPSTSEFELPLLALAALPVLLQPELATEFGQLQTEIDSSNSRPEGVVEVVN